MLTFNQYITEIFNTKLKAPKPVIRTGHHYGYDDPTAEVHRYNLTGKQTGGPRGVVEIIRKPGADSAYVSYDFNNRSTARNKKVLPTKTALKALGHVMAAVKHHIDNHELPTKEIQYHAESPRRDRMYQMIGKRLGIPMKNKNPSDALGVLGIIRDVTERGSRIGSMKKKKEYINRVVKSLAAKGKTSGLHKTAASKLKGYARYPEYL